MRAEDTMDGENLSLLLAREGHVDAAFIFGRAAAPNQPTNRSKRDGAVTTPSGREGPNAENVEGPRGSLGVCVHCENVLYAGLTCSLVTKRQSAAAARRGASRIGQVYLIARCRRCELTTCVGRGLGPREKRKRRLVGVLAKDKDMKKRLKHRRRLKGALEEASKQALGVLKATTARREVAEPKLTLLERLALKEEQGKGSSGAKRKAETAPNRQAPSKAPKKGNNVASGSERSRTKPKEEPTSSTLAGFLTALRK
mmetsp:Transcript_4670/g.8791  ORF Transcript_4670/g.8791 Transcript_4670/m.8791 type:complete len:256 (-) Transcript_4670:1869-2636(-)